MTDMMQEFSLAALAGLDVSDIEETRYELLAKGTYDFEVISASMTEGTNRDNEKRLTAEFELQVLECVATIEPGVDRESLAGKKMTVRNQVDPAETAEKIKDAIGRIRATCADMGLADWGTNVITNVENVKGNRFRATVEHRSAKDNPDVKFPSLKFPPKPKA